MSLTTQQLDVLYKLYPSIIRTDGDTAYDANGQEVTYSLSRVDAKIEADKAAQTAAKTSALNKLKALGLTEEEALALGAIK
jgi:hypothetical protein